MRRPTPEEYRAAAKELWHRDGAIEIDDNAEASLGADNGAYVAAWVWVYDSEVNLQKKEHVCSSSP